MGYSRTIAVEFNHCDPAGIVFYPRYFEMVNSVIENFFAGVLGYSFARIHLDEGHAVPTAQIDIRFLRPSRLGERLTFTLDVARVGRSSVTLAIAAAGGDETRLEARMVLVWVGPEGRAETWPETLRTGLMAAGNFQA